MHLCYNRSKEIDQLHYSQECRTMNRQEQSTRENNITLVEEALLYEAFNYVAQSLKRMKRNENYQTQRRYKTCISCYARLAKDAARCYLCQTEQDGTKRKECA